MTERIVIGSDGRKYITNEPAPQRKWQGLTDEEILDAWLTHRNTSEATDGFARAIEAKLKEKNAPNL